MNKFISLLKNLRLRQILTVLIAGLSLFFIQAVGNISPAQADETVKSPYGYYYKGTPDESVSDRDSNFLNRDRNAFEQNRNAYRDRNAFDQSKGGIRDRNAFDQSRAKIGSQELRQSPQSSSQGSANVGDTVKSPYGYYYKGTPDENAATGDRNFPSNDNQLVDNARKNLRNATNAVPEATKDFVQSAKEKVGKTVDSLSGNQNQTESQQGYYQRPDFQNRNPYQKPLDK